MLNYARISCVLFLIALITWIEQLSSLRYTISLLKNPKHFLLFLWIVQTSHLFFWWCQKLPVDDAVCIVKQKVTLLSPFVCLICWLKVVCYYTTELVTAVKHWFVLLWRLGIDIGLVTFNIAPIVQDHNFLFIRWNVLFILLFFKCIIK